MILENWVQTYSPSSHQPFKLLYTFNSLSINLNLTILTLFPNNSIAGGNFKAWHPFGFHHGIRTCKIWVGYGFCLVCQVWKEPLSKILVDSLLCVQVLWCEFMWRIETILCWWMARDEASDVSENLVMLTLLWLSEGKRPLTFRHIVYIARCLFLGPSTRRGLVSLYFSHFSSICVVSCFSQDILTLLLVLGLWPVGGSMLLKSNLGQVCYWWVIGCDESAIELEVRSLKVVAFRWGWWSGVQVWK